MPTVFIDFNHWRLAGSQKKHCVMCSFLAFIKETQCSAVTLPSSPGNLPTPCDTSFIGGDGARGLGWFYFFIYFFYVVLQQGFRNSLRSAPASSRSPKPVSASGEISSTPKGDEFGGDENTECCDSLMLLLLKFLCVCFWGRVKRAVCEPQGCGYQ